MKKNNIYILFFIINSFLWAEMMRPSDGSSVSYTHILFEWQQEPEALEYEVQLSNSSSFSSPITSLTESLIYIDTNNISWDNSYFWRVRPIYSDDTSGDWGTER